MALPSFGSVYCLNFINLFVLRTSHHLCAFTVIRDPLE